LEERFNGERWIAYGPGYKNFSSRILSYRADWYRVADP